MKQANKASYFTNITDNLPFYVSKITQDRVSESPNSQNPNSVIDLCFGLYHPLAQEMLNVVFKQ